MKIGAILKKIRQDKGYKLKEVAERLSLTASHISQVENDKISPSLHSLEELLSLYSIKISDFFSQVEKQDYIIQRKEDMESLVVEKNSIRLNLLASKLHSNVMETYMLEMNSGAEQEISKLPVDQNGERLIYVYKGELNLHFENSNHLLQTGDSINFKAYISCTISNSGIEKNNLLLSGTPPVLW